MDTQFSQIWYRVRRTRCNKEGENIPEYFVEYCRTHGVTIWPPPFFRNVTEQLNVLVRSGGPEFVFYFSLLNNIVSSGWCYVSCKLVMNSLTYSRINSFLPTIRWDPNTIIDFSSLPPTCQTGYSFIHCSHKGGGEKLLPRSDLSSFVTFESYLALIRVFTVYHHQKVLRLYSVF